MELQIFQPGARISDYLVPIILALGQNLEPEQIRALLDNWQVLEGLLSQIEVTPMMTTET